MTQVIGILEILLRKKALKGGMSSLSSSVAMSTTVDILSKKQTALLLSFLKTQVSDAKKCVLYLIFDSVIWTLRITITSNLILPELIYEYLHNSKLLFNSIFALLKHFQNGILEALNFLLPSKY